MFDDDNTEEEEEQDASDFLPTCVSEPCDEEVVDLPYCESTECIGDNGPFYCASTQCSEDRQKIEQYCASQDCIDYWGLEFCLFSDCS